MSGPRLCQESSLYRRTERRRRTQLSSNPLRPLEGGKEIDRSRKSPTIPSIYPETLAGISSKFYGPLPEKHPRGQEPLCIPTDNSDTGKLLGTGCRRRSFLRLGN